MKKLMMLTFSILMCSMITYATIDTPEKDGKNTLDDSTAVDVNLKADKFAKNDLENMTLVVLDEPFIKDGIPQGTLQSFSKMSFPKESKVNSEEGTVFVSFTYTEDGYIKVLSTNASSEKFNSYIVDELQKMRLSYGTITVGKEYFTKFDFRVL